MIDDAPDVRLEPPPERHPLRTVASWLSPRLVLGVVLGLLAVELGLRMLELRTGDLSVSITTTSTQVSRLAAGPHDVVVIGSSSAGSAVWMPDLEAAGAACDGYVAWIPTPTMHDLAEFTQNFVLRPHPPTEVVVAVTMREFVPADPGIVSEVETMLSPKTWLERNVHIVSARPTLQDPFQFGLAIERGLNEDLSDDGNQVIMRDRRIAGESAAHRDQETRHMADFRLLPETTAAFRGLVETIQAAGVTPIVVNLPVTDRYVELAPGGAADYESYVDAVTDVSVATGARFVDLGGLPLDEEAQFADVNHLNADGSRLLTAALAPQLGGCRS